MGCSGKKDAYAHVAVEITLFQFAERDPVWYSMFYNLKRLLDVELRFLIVIKVLRIVPCAYRCRAEHDVVGLVVSAYINETTIEKKKSNASCQFSTPQKSGRILCSKSNRAECNGKKKVPRAKVSKRMPASLGPSRISSTSY